MYVDDSKVMLSDVEFCEKRSNDFSDSLQRSWTGSNDSPNLVMWTGPEKGLSIKNISVKVEQFGGWVQNVKGQMIQEWDVEMSYVFEQAIDDLLS